MANEPVTTIIGNLTGDPELRFSQTGIAVANFTVASTPRSKDSTTGEWVDGEPLFVRCSVWREYAENVAQSLTRGQQVIVHGALRSRSWDDKEGNRRTGLEMQVYEVGGALRFSTAQYQKATRQQPQGGYQAPPQAAPVQQNLPQNPTGVRPAQNQPQAQAQQGTDPWSQQAGGNYDWGVDPNATPPF